MDQENEWFLDAAKETLYLIPNATAGPPAEQYVAVVLETLISVNGTKAAPVKDITIQGITFRDAADITMRPWGVPSGGDWGLYRGGAIFVEGAEHVTIQHNTLTRLDGNGVFVSGYTRDVTITDNEFSWIGCNPMASWGYTDEDDGTDGQQPRWTSVLRNYVRLLSPLCSTLHTCRHTASASTASASSSSSVSHILVLRAACMRRRCASGGTTRSRVPCGRTTRLAWSR